MGARRLSSKEYKVLAHAVNKAGAAAYLSPHELVSLERKGLVRRSGEFRYLATDAGLRRFLLGG